MTIHDRTVTAEQVTSAAVIQWMARAKAIKAMSGDSLEKTLEDICAPSGIAERIKAAAETTTSQPGLAGGTTKVQSFISQAAQNSVLLRMIADRATYQVPLRTAVYLPDADMTAQVVGEGQPVPVQGVSLDRTRIDSFKIAGAIVVTEELARNISAQGQAFLNTQLRAAVAKASDIELFTRLTDSGTPAISVNGSAGDVLSGVRTALAATTTRATDRPYYAFSVGAAAWFSALEGLPENCDIYGGIFLNRPCVVTEALADMRMATINAQSVAGHVDRLDISASRDGTVEMLDSPTNDSMTPTATNQVSLFQTHSAAIKVVTHLACEPIREDGVAFVDIELLSGS